MVESSHSILILTFSSALKSLDTFWSCENGVVFILIFRYIYPSSKVAQFITMNKCLSNTMLSISFYINSNKKISKK